MKFCSVCGAQMTQEMSTCPQCGARAQNPSEAPLPAQPSSFGTMNTEPVEFNSPAGSTYSSTPAQSQPTTYPPVTQADGQSTAPSPQPSLTSMHTPQTSETPAPSSAASVTNTPIPVSSTTDMPTPTTGYAQQTNQIPPAFGQPAPMLHPSQTAGATTYLPQTVTTAPTKKKTPYVIGAVAVVIVVLAIIAALIWPTLSKRGSVASLGKPGLPTGTWSLHVSGTGYDLSFMNAEVDDSGKTKVTMMDTPVGTCMLKVSDYDAKTVTYKVDSFKTDGSTGHHLNNVPMTITMPRHGVVGSWVVKYRQDGEANQLSATVNGNGNIVYRWNVNGSHGSYKAKWAEKESTDEKRSYSIPAPPQLYNNEGLLESDQGISFIFNTPAKR
jgi:hypothetical protein